jgi:hypothetical protein
VPEFAARLGEQVVDRAPRHDTQATARLRLNVLRSPL